MLRIGLSKAVDDGDDFFKTWVNLHRYVVNFETHNLFTKENK